MRGATQRQTRICGIIAKAALLAGIFAQAPAAHATDSPGKSDSPFRQFDWKKAFYLNGSRQFLEANEGKLCGVGQIGFNELGVYLSVRLYGDIPLQADPPRTKGPAESRSDNSSRISLSFSTRSPDRTDSVGAAEANLYRGFFLRPFSGNVNPDMLTVDRSTPNNVAEQPVAGAATLCRQETDGWRIDCFVPWSSLPSRLPEDRGWLSASVGASLSDPDSQSSGRGYWSAQFQGYLPANKISSSDISGNLLPADGPFFEVSAKEVMIKGNPWLEVEVAAEKAGTKLLGKTLTVSSRTLALAARIPFIDSYSGKFVFAQARYPLADLGSGITSVNLDLGQEELGWTQECPVDIPATVAQRQVEASLPNREIDALPLRERGVAHVYKSAALECAERLLGGNRSRDSVAAAAARKNGNDKQMEACVQFVRELVRGKKLEQSFPLYAWYSHIEGCWIPILVYSPFGQLPGERFPAQIQIEAGGLGTYVSSLVGKVERDLATRDKPRFEGDKFMIVPFGYDIGENAFGQEEMEAIWRDIIPALPIDPRAVSLAGYSRGGFNVMSIALRSPDRYAWLQSRSGNFGVNFKGLNDDEAVLFARNLRLVPLFLEAGEKDSPDVEANRMFAVMFKGAGVPCDYHERLKAGHNFIGDDVPLPIGGHRTEAAPREFSFSTRTADFGKAYWIEIDQMMSPGRVANIAVHPKASRAVAVESDNVRAFSVDWRNFSSENFPLTLQINGARLIAVQSKPRASTTHFVYSDGRWRVGTTQGPGGKIKGRCGPSQCIYGAPVVFVYGTLNSETMPWLRERAFRLARGESAHVSFQGKSGSHNREVLADTELKAADLAGCNLWLIGGPQENRWVADMKTRLPILADAGKIDLGARVMPGANLLLSYIYADPARKDGYCYFEMGTSKQAYSAPALATPECDACIQQIETGTARVRWTANFDNDWKLESAYAR